VLGFEASRASCPHINPFDVAVISVRIIQAQAERNSLTATAIQFWITVLNFIIPIVFRVQQKIIALAFDASRGGQRLVLECSYFEC